MIEVFLRDLDGQPVSPLSVKLQAIPAKGDRVIYWDSGDPETGGLGMMADVDHVRHNIHRGDGDHVISLALKNIQTVDAQGKIFPRQIPSDSDAVGQSDGPRRA